MPPWGRWILGLTLAAIVVGVPWVAYRALYAHAKRFREVTPGRFYRSGQMTADGLRQFVRRFGIKTVVNLQNEAPDPLIRHGYFGRPAIRESEVCAELGAKYVLLEPDLRADGPGDDPTAVPLVLGDYLKILDDPAAYPVLIHCKAGLHRTGLLAAVYRMEYEDWAVGDAVRELRANGFGDDACTDANAYVDQYIKRYRVRPRAANARTDGGAAR